jgi:hypothetical protein
MTDFPSHFLPNYSDQSKADALFHYTTAAGLIGILTSGQIWSTAYYCTNDESELSTGQGILRPLFFQEAHRLREQGDRRVEIFTNRGVDIEHYADTFENSIAGASLSQLCAYITCFFRPASKEDFLHGLLSQWRGYGADGGYALHFSRSKLEKQLERFAGDSVFQYDLQDVHYTTDNALKADVLSHKQAFLAAFLKHIDELAQPLTPDDRPWTNPISSLPGGPLEAYLTYISHTKNLHFAEERETRLSLTQYVPTGNGCQPVHYFNRDGLIIPYVISAKDRLNILECIEWVVVGPGPRLQARFKAVTQLLRQVAPNIEVRASHIPFTRS